MALVLLADDDSHARELARLALLPLGLEVLEAADGLEAIKLLERRIDVAVLDIAMPGASGTEVCQAIRSRPDGDSIPVLFVTARDGEEAKIDGLTRGADEYLTKPFNHEELLARVRSLLRLRGVYQELERRNRELVDLQAQVVARERSALAEQISGTTAHRLGQPAAAILLNCHLLERLAPSDPNYPGVVAALRREAERLSSMLQEIREADPNRTAGYFGKSRVLSEES